ncbi:MAG: sterol desaturase family protein [Rhodospirillales bacterium]
MTDTVLDHEAFIRLGFFFGVLVVMASWEGGSPRRPRSQSRALRWTGNLGIVALNTALIRLLFPVVPVSLALVADGHDIGLFNVADAPCWLAVFASVVLLDLAIYGQHVMFHAVPWLWRLHRMHHADLDFDVTTGVRFHPIEIALSILIKMAVIAVLGAPAVAVLIFEVLLNATSMFNHGNVYLPTGVDRVLRWVVVTPEMHRVHHSIIRAETDSNFGFNLPWWDRLFGTYRDQPREGHVGMTIGLPIFRDPTWLRLDRLVVQPFANENNADLGA